MKKRLMQKTTINRPDYPEVRQIVDRERRIIAVNIGAQKEAKIILLLPRGRTLRL